MVKPIFDVSDMWSRHECQSRGSGVTHGVLWLRDAPDIKEIEPSDEDIDILQAYFDDKYFAFNPCMRNTSGDPLSTSFEIC